METNYASNSNKTRAKEAQEQAETREKLEKVISSEVTERKKSIFAQILSSFFEQDLADVKQSLWRDVVLPNLQDGLYELMQNSIAVIFGRAPSNRRSGTGAKVDYAGKYKYGSTVVNERKVDTATSRYDFSNLVFHSYNDADEVLGTMVEYIDRYDAISVAAFLDLIGKDNNHADVKYGWTSLGAAKIKRVKEGYILDLPNVTLL